MTRLQGAGGINQKALEKQSAQLTAEFETQNKTFKDLRRYAVDEVASEKGKVVPRKPESQRLIEQEIKAGSSPIDWDRFVALRNASDKELEAAFKRFKAIDQLDVDFQKLIAGSAEIVSGVDIEALGTHDARRRYLERAELLGLIEAVRRGLKAAGDSPATANFPTKQLDLLEKQLREDLAALVDLQGPGVKLPPPSPPERGGKKKPEPSAELLDPTAAVRPQDVATAGDAARVIAEKLGAPELAAIVRDAAARVPEADRDRMQRYLGAYAILADEATYAPDYRKDPRGWGPEHRQHYRARLEAETKKGASRKRREASREALQAPIRALAAAKAPLAELEGALVRELLRELGLDEKETRGWTPTAATAAAVLEGEALLPLRALNERGPLSVEEEHEDEMRAVVRTLTQAIVEGRFEEWRAGHDASRGQLALITEDQQKIWFDAHSITREIQTKDGPVKLTTSEPRGLERLWATKVGGPSHGFDTMTQCAVPLLTNARNDTIVVEDPRWPNFAGRTYLRLVEREATHEPVLYLESSHGDFPYPGSKQETEKAIIQHAVAKAKAMGVQLAISGRCVDAIEDLGLEGVWREEKYRLAPSLFLEAASIFGAHDWVQKESEVRGGSSPQFYVAM